MNIVKRPAVRIGAETTRWMSTPPYARTRTTFPKPWTCPDCRTRIQTKRVPERDAIWRRSFTTSSRRRDDIPKKSISPNEAISTMTSESSTSSASTATYSTESKSLPSHVASQRTELSKRMSTLLDNLLSKASIASQHINAYTGTDYSGIETLRREITSQEQKVRSYHKLVEEAKARHHEADLKQKSAQREIVGLLERKSSWSPADLERYMSLVRSEHLNDQDVQAAKDGLKEAERELEDSRVLLEKLERKQYHEEQVWSDTIRRNSTWVTFGLMGVNIVLLLANILIFEPYRRRKIVKDVKLALDEKTVSQTPAIGEMEREVDALVSPVNVPVEQDETKAEQPLDAVLPAKEETVGKAPLAAGEMLPPEAADFAGAVPEKETAVPSSVTAKAPANSWEAYQEAFRDLFSERIVQLRKVDVTNTALQGAATGVAMMGLIFLLLRPK